MKTKYVVGFAFSRAGIYLIRKNRPEWQAGKLNGIGGKIEPGESPGNAMEREFLEETGAKVLWWKHFATLEGDNSRVYCFTIELEPGVVPCTTTDEKVVWFGWWGAVPWDLAVPNLRWLIPMAASEETLRAEVQF